MEQSGHVAIVTGGNRGIGYEICKELSRAGCHVVLSSRIAIAKASAKITLVGTMNDSESSSPPAMSNAVITPWSFDHHLHCEHSVYYLTSKSYTKTA